MNRDIVNAHCATLPDADLSQPFGDGYDVWKVGGKIFAITGTGKDGVSIKCADIEAAQMLIEMGIAKRAPYLHASWVLIEWDAVEEAELFARVDKSYNIIRSSLTKKAQAALASL